MTTTTEITAVDPTVYVDPCPGMKGTDHVTIFCGKCDGHGVIGYGNVVLRGVVRGHIADDRICFDCNGRGERQVLVSSMRDKARRHAKEALARRDAPSKEEAVWVEWAVSNVEVAAALVFLVDADQSIAREMVSKVGQYGGLSQKQIDWMLRLAAEVAGQAEKEAAEEAAKRPVVEGRGQVTGTVLGFTEKEDTFSYHGGTVLKIIVADDRGFKVYGTAPTTLVNALYDRWLAAEQAEQGDDFYVGNYGPDYWRKSAQGARVTFTATVERSKDDEAFGYFKRPTKAEVA